MGYVAGTFYEVCGKGPLMSIKQHEVIGAHVDLSQVLGGRQRARARETARARARDYQKQMTLDTLLYDVQSDYEERSYKEPLMFPNALGLETDAMPCLLSCLRSFSVCPSGLPSHPLVLSPFISLSPGGLEFGRVRRG